MHESVKHVLQGKTSLLHFTKYNVRFYLKTLISKYPRDETLTLVFKMIRAQETLATLRERERESIIEYIRERGVVHSY